MALSDSYIASKRALRYEHLAFDVEGWYELLSDLTFKTEFIELTQAEARAITVYYGARYNSRQAAFRTEHGVAIRKLRRRLDEVLQGDFKAKGAFVRLSSRSPKDGMPFEATEMDNVYRDAIANITAAVSSSDAPEEKTAEPDANTKMRAISRASSACWRVRDGDGALSLILSSERVFVDLIEALTCLETTTEDAAASPAPALAPAPASPPGPAAATPEPPWSTKISVRLWEEALEDQFEFRCFVHDHVLVAISQYNHYCVFPACLAGPEPARLQRLISAFCIEEVCPRLAGVACYDTGYIVDVGVLPVGERCVVIELNPYKPTTGAGLFDWQRDAGLLLAAPAEHSEPAQTEPQSRHDGTCVEVGSPPLRLRTRPMPGLERLVDVMLSELDLDRDSDAEALSSHGRQAGQPQPEPETYMDVLTSLEADAQAKSSTVLEQRDSASGPRWTCICQ